MILQGQAKCNRSMFTRSGNFLKPTFNFLVIMKSTAFVTTITDKLKRVIFQKAVLTDDLCSD